MYTVLLYYKYLPISDPLKLSQEQSSLGQKLNLKGLIIISAEGINGTVEGLDTDTESYIQKMRKNPDFYDLQFKKSPGTGHAFPKLSVKVRNEIVAARLGQNDIKPYHLTGQYITAENLHHWIHSDKEFYIVDIRNDFEQQVGYFQNSILTQMSSFADLAQVLPKLEHLKGKTIVTVCTGGVRCEKASGFLLKHGFRDVYQLDGGIVTYMKKYPNEDFLGLLYVFDNRLVIGFNVLDPKRVVVGKCASCKKNSENFINCLDNFCHRHFICCQKCLNGKAAILCPMGCRDYSLKHPELFQKSSDP